MFGGLGAADFGRMGALGVTGIGSILAGTTTATATATATATSTGVAFSLVFEAPVQVSATTGSPVTFTSASFGSSDPNRIIAIMTAAREVTSAVPTAMTIGGNTATLVSGTQISSGVAAAAIWYASVPASTSGDVVVSWSGSLARSMMYGYSIITANTTPADGQSIQNAASSASVNLTVPTGGAGIALFFDQVASLPTFSAGATQDSMDSIAATNTAECGHTTATGVVTITANTTGSVGVRTLVAASWGP